MKHVIRIDQVQYILEIYHEYYVLVIRILAEAINNN